MSAVNWTIPGLECAVRLWCLTAWQWWFLNGCCCIVWKSRQRSIVSTAVSSLVIYSILFLFNIAEYQCFQSSEMWHLYKICDCCISKELGALSTWHPVDSATYSWMRESRQTRNFRLWPMKTMSIAFKNKCLSYVWFWSTSKGLIWLIKLEEVFISVLPLEQSKWSIKVIVVPEIKKPNPLLWGIYYLGNFFFLHCSSK